MKKEGLKVINEGGLNAGTKHKLWKNTKLIVIFFLVMSCVHGIGDKYIIMYLSIDINITDSETVKFFEEYNAFKITGQIISKPFEMHWLWDWSLSVCIFLTFNSV